MLFTLPIWENIVLSLDSSNVYKLFSLKSMLLTFHRWEKTAQRHSSSSLYKLLFLKSMLLIFHRWEKMAWSHDLSKVHKLLYHKLIFFTLRRWENHRKEMKAWILFWIKAIKRLEFRLISCTQGLFSIFEKASPSSLGLTCVGNFLIMMEGGMEGVSLSSSNEKVMGIDTSVGGQSSSTPSKRILSQRACLRWGANAVAFRRFS